jgi:hypothetical protein
MNETAFRNMVAYQAAMGLARCMLRQSIITEGEYAKIDTIMIKKHNIPLGSIFR